MSVISQMKNKKDFTESYCTIADFILEKGSLVLEMSVQEVARLSYTCLTACRGGDGRCLL